MAFIDVLALWQATLLLAAILLAYVGVVAYAAIRRNDIVGLRSAIRGASIPLGGLGAIVVSMGLWTEMMWPLPGSYNILFGDMYLLFGLVLVAFAASAYLSLKMQYAGLFAAATGGITILYGISGYHLGMTKNPLETLSLFGAFGLAGILAFPATLVYDQYLHHGSDQPVFRSLPSFGRRRALGTRAAQPIVANRAGEVPTAPVEDSEGYVVPRYITILALAFPIFMVLAGIAAMLYLGTTVPAHLQSPP
jgi:putative membrane protein